MRFFFIQLIVLGLAVLLDLGLGDPPNRFHPVVWMGRLIEWGEKRAPQAEPVVVFIYGLLLVLSGVVICTLPVLVLLTGAWWLGQVIYVLAAALLLKSTFTYSGLAGAAREIVRALQSADLVEARRLVSWHLVSRDTAGLDEGLVVAATVESVAENVTDGFTAPLFFFLLAGVPGAWAYRFFNTCDSMLGYRDPVHEYLGKFAAHLDDVVNWLPARLTGLLIVAAAWLAREDARGAWHTMWSQHGRTASPNAGWTMCAMAGALNVTLEKVDHYRLDGGAGVLVANTIRRATRVAGLAVGLAVSVLTLALILLGSGVPL
jgi:adenosylcobinamide-phosphate synthase